MIAGGENPRSESCGDCEAIASWITVCEFDDLIPDVGARALVGDRQVALFRLSRSDAVYAIDAFDPFSNAAVLSRGIVGDVKGKVVVASPIYKQHFDLATGCCLEDESVAVRTFPVRVVDGEVQVDKLRLFGPATRRFLSASPTKASRN